VGVTLLSEVWSSCVILVTEKHILSKETESNRRLELLHNQEVHNIVRVMKSRRMRWTGHVARMVGMKMDINF
jgi:hypothetical protein